MERRNFLLGSGAMPFVGVLPLSKPDLEPSAFVRKWNIRGKVVRNVTTISEFNAAVTRAAPGDNINISAGAYAGKITVNGRSFAGAPLTVTASGPIRAKKFECRASANVVWDFNGQHIYFEDPNASSDSPFFDLSGARNCTVKNAHFHGYNGLGRCFYIIGRNGFHDGVTIFNNKIEGFFRGIVSWNGSNFSILRNEIFYTTGDHMQFGALFGALIEGNYIHSTVGDGPGRTHSDAIQFVNYNSNVGEVAERVTIRSNIIDVRDGPEYMQSIFIANEVVDGVRGVRHPELKGDRRVYYKDFLIEENVIYNLQTHGITVGACDGLTIRKNTLIKPAFNYSRYPNQPNTYPAIRLAGRYAHVNVSITDNVSGSYSINQKPTGTFVNRNNLTILSSAYTANFDQGAKPYQAYALGPNNWKVKAGSPVDRAQAGASSMLSN